MPALIKRSSVAVLLALLVLLFRVDHAWADEVPVCSMSRDEFVGAAFPDNIVTKLYGGRLLKHARPPELVVLAPAERSAMSAQIEDAFAKIAKDDLVRPIRSSFLTYSKFSEVAEVVEQLGNGNIFVLVAEEPTDSSELREFRLILERIVHRRKDVDALVDQSKRTGSFTSRSLMDLGTAEVRRTAVVINPRNDDAQIGTMVYLAYYAGISLNASSTESFLRRFFERTPDTGAEMTDFGRKYFRVFGDDRVKNGATKDSFVECSG